MDPECKVNIKEVGHCIPSMMWVVSDMVKKRHFFTRTRRFLGEVCDQRGVYSYTAASMFRYSAYDPVCIRSWVRSGFETNERLSARV